MESHEKLFKEFENHLLEDTTPSRYFNNLLAEDIFYEVYPFTLLGNLVKTEQEPKHHPEGNVWRHTMMVVDEAAARKSSSEDPRVLMWAALLHDLGKATTTRIRKGRITSYDHDKEGKKLSEEFLKNFTDDAVFIKKVSSLIRWHMQVLFVCKSMQFADMRSMLKEVSLNEIALLSYCDRMGRGSMDDAKTYEEKRNIDLFIKKCKEFLDMENLKV